MPKPSSFTEHDVRPPAPVRIFKRDSKTLEFQEGDFTICTAVWSPALFNGDLVISSSAGEWHVPDAYQQTLTNATHSSGLVIDLSYVALPSTIGARLKVGDRLYHRGQLGTGQGLYDQAGRLILQTAAIWRDSEVKQRIVCGIWPKELPPAPLDSLLLVAAMLLQNLVSLDLALA